MGEVTITVNGRPYRMSCEDGQESHLDALGNELASRVDELAGQVGQVGDAQLLVMAALITADEGATATSGNALDESLVAERNGLATELAALKSENAALAKASASTEQLDALVAERDAIANDFAAARAVFEQAAADQGNSTSDTVNALTAERDNIAQELAVLHAEKAQLIAGQEAQVADEASAAEAIDALTGRVVRLAEVLTPH